MPPSTPVALAIAPRRRGVQDRRSVLAEAELARLVDLGLRPLELRRRTGQHHRAALRPVAVDALRGGDAADLVDRLVHRALHRHGRVVARHPRQLAQRRREERRAPAAVPPRRAEPGDLPLAYHDPQAGVALRQVVSGPQAGEARPDDGDVRLGVAGQRVAWPPACLAQCRARTTTIGTDQIGPCGTSWQVTGLPWQSGMLGGMTPAKPRQPGRCRRHAIRSSRTGSASSASAISAGRRWRSGSWPGNSTRPG